MAEETAITIVGNAVEDAELRFTPSGAALAKFRVASTPRHFDKASGQFRDGEALFLQVVVWRQMAENVGESVTKGTRLVVTGRLKQRSYETREGEKRTAYEIEADEVAISLKFATAKANRMSRTSGGQGAAPSGNAADPWAGNVPATAGSGGGFESEPPF